MSTPTFACHNLRPQGVERGIPSAAKTEAALGLLEPCLPHVVVEGVTDFDTVVFLVVLDCRRAIDAYVDDELSQRLTSPAVTPNQGLPAIWFGSCRFTTA